MHGSDPCSATGDGPHTVKRLGKARVARFLYRHSRGRWGEEEAEALLGAATETLSLWAGDLEFAELADDIAIEARLALRLGEELKDFDERIEIFLAEADPTGILTSVPGVGRVLGGQHPPAQAVYQRRRRIGQELAGVEVDTSRCG
jgi:hypothetical protein